MKALTSIYIVFVLFIVVGCLSGYQKVNKVEFYKPTKVNKLYCVPSSGTPDFSDVKFLMSN